MAKGNGDQICILVILHVKIHKIEKKNKKVSFQTFLSLSLL